MADATRLLKVEIPEDVFRQVKIAAVSKDQFMREWVLDAIMDKLIIEGQAGSIRARKEHKKK